MREQAEEDFKRRDAELEEAFQSMAWTRTRSASKTKNYPQGTAHLHRAWQGARAARDRREPPKSGCARYAGRRDLSGPENPRLWKDTEVQPRESYRTMAHHQDPADTVAPEKLEATRQAVPAAYARGASMAGWDLPAWTCRA